MMSLVWAGPETVETAGAELADTGILLSGTVTARDWRATYRVSADAGWQAERVEIALGDGRGLAAARAAGWGRGCAACTDPDLSATPMTNTLPIRRLGLDIGQSAEIVALHILVPELSFKPARQRYTRIAARRWLYEGLDTGFQSEIDVDADGFVTNYPGLFERSNPEHSS